VNERAKTQEINAIFRRVPQGVRRFLHVGCGDGLLCAVVAKAYGAEAYGVPGAGAIAPVASPRWTLLEPLGAVAPYLWPFPPGHVDLIVIDGACMSSMNAAEFRAVGALLSSSGFLLLSHLPGLESDSLESHLGLSWLATWPAVDDGGVAVHCFAREGFSPGSLAQAYLAAGRPEWAYEYLASFLESEHGCSEPVLYLLQMQAVEQLCLAGQQTPLRAHAGLLHLVPKADAGAPQRQEAAVLMANSWERLGDSRMAARVRGLAELPAVEAAPAQAAPQQEAAPVWRDAWRPRVLFLTESRPHYGLDVLFDGLSRVLGADRVVEYPCKHSLHNGELMSHTNYPVAFSWPRADVDDAATLRALSEGGFDLILVGALEIAHSAALAEALAAAPARCVVVSVDAEDDCTLRLEDRAPFVDLWRPCLQFKRELLKCLPVAPGLLPLPFSYPDDLVAAEITGARTTEIFWAGAEEAGARRAWLDKLRAITPMPALGYVSQTEYRERLRHSRLGLSLAGGGFDTVRYWEIPAQGAALISERLPIRIPHDFQDMREAIFFDSPRDFAERLRYVEAHPECIEEIRLRGHAHLREHHTASARACQLLGWIAEVRDLQQG